MPFPLLAALAAVSAGSGLGAGVLQGRATRKANRKNRKAIAYSNLINSLSPRAQNVPNLRDPKEGNLQKFLEGLSQAASIGGSVIGAHRADRLQAAKIAGLEGADAAVREAMERSSGETSALGAMPETAITGKAPTKKIPLGYLSGFGEQASKQASMGREETLFDERVPQNTQYADAKLLAGAAEQRAGESERRSSLLFGERVPEREAFEANKLLQRDELGVKRLAVQSDMTEVIAQITRTQNLADLVSQNPASFENLGDKDRAEVMLRLTPEVLSQVSGKPLSPVDARQITESKVALKALDFYKMEFASAGPEGLDIIGPVESRTNLPSGNSAAAVTKLELLQSDLALAIRSMRESGVMTDEDFERNLKLIPSPSGFYPKEFIKFEALRGRLVATISGRIESFGAQRFNVSGLSDDDEDEELLELVKQAEEGNLSAKLKLRELGYE